VFPPIFIKLTGAKSEKKGKIFLDINPAAFVCHEREPDIKIQKHHACF
jgi:hypothetical protein